MDRWIDGYVCSRKEFSKASCTNGHTSSIAKHSSMNEADSKEILNKQITKSVACEQIFLVQFVYLTSAATLLLDDENTFAA